MSYSINPQLPTELLDIAECLPHGAGFNGRWNGYTTKTYVNFYMIYYPMNYDGYYDGHVQFTVKLPLVNNQIIWREFKLQFNGSTSRYYALKYYLRGYIAGEMYEALHQYFEDKS